MDGQEETITQAYLGLIGPSGSDKAYFGILGPIWAYSVLTEYMGLFWRRWPIWACMGELGHYWAYFALFGLRRPGLRSASANRENVRERSPSDIRG